MADVDLPESESFQYTNLQIWVSRRGMVEEWGCKAKTPSVCERIRHVRFHFSVTRYMDAKRWPP